MPITADITRDIVRMSKPKKPRPHVEIRKALDMGPTPERMAKADYEDAPNAKGQAAGRRRGDILKLLEKSGAISGEAVNAANRWYGDFVFWQDGSIEIEGEKPEGYVKGDIHTFNTARGKAAERISMVRDTIGENAHRWLVFLLIHGFSVSALGVELFPDDAPSTQRSRVRHHAEMLLTILPNAYKAARQKQKDDRERAAEMRDYRERLGLPVHSEK